MIALIINEIERIRKELDKTGSIDGVPLMWFGFNLPIPENKKLTKEDFTFKFEEDG